MASTALLDSIVHTRIRLQRVTRLRIGLAKRAAPTAASGRASVRAFVERRLPILKFHNDALKVDLLRPATKRATDVGIDVLRGHEWFHLPHSRVTDDELLELIVALDRGEVPDGVEPGQRLAEASAATATPAAAAAAAPKPAQAQA